MRVVVENARGQKVTESRSCEKAGLEGAAVVARNDAGQAVFTYVLQPGDTVQERKGNVVVSQRGPSETVVVRNTPSQTPPQRSSWFSLRMLFVYIVLAFLAYQALVGHA
ncbi:MAG: hypothetical protein AAB289_02625 [Chloroflexota bacterium]